MKKLTAVLLSALLVVLCLAGCGNQENPSSEPKTGSDTFVYGINSDIDDFNPMSNQMTNYVCLFVFNVYEPLLHLDANMQYAYDLATKIDVVDELTYNVTLRENVKFHNGQAFTAQDVINTINYIKDEANGAWRAPQYATVESMTADGDYKLTIKLNAATPAFLDNLAYTPIFCKEDDPKNLSAAANGTGAFKFVKWVPNDQIVLEKFADYWDAAKVSVKNLILKPFSDYTVGLTNLESGALNGLNGISAENQVSVESKTGMKVVAAPSSNTVDLFEIGLHNCKALADKNVIQAMRYAFDANAINEAAYHGKGTVLTSCYPSGTKYHKDIIQNEYNLDKAKDCLDKSAYKDGFEFNLELLKGYDAGETAAVIWQQSLAKIGIKVNIKTEEMSVWLENYLARSYDMIWNEYGMVGSDPATFNSIILEGLCDKYQCKDIPEIKDLMAKGKSTADEAVRKDTYEKIQQIVADYAPVYPYIAAPIACATRDNVSGLSVNGMGHVFLKTVAVG